MTVYQISSSSSEGASVDYGATGVAAILQSVSFLLDTLVDSYPMHREFGMDPPIDDPSETAKNEWSAQVIEKLERNIPQVSVQEVIVDQDETDLLNGRIKTTVKVVIEIDTI